MTDKLLTVFAGTTICVPSTKNQRNATRDIQIYETLSGASSLTETKQIIEELSKKYKMSRRHIRKVHKNLRKLFKQNLKLKEADLAVGQHRVEKVRVRHKKKLRGM